MVPVQGYVCAREKTDLNEKGEARRLGELVRSGQYFRTLVQLEDAVCRFRDFAPAASASRLGSPPSLRRVVDSSQSMAGTPTCTLHSRLQMSCASGPNCLRPRLRMCSRLRIHAQRSILRSHTHRRAVCDLQNRNRSEQPRRTDTALRAAAPAAALASPIAPFVVLLAWPWPLLLVPPPAMRT